MELKELKNLTDIKPDKIYEIDSAVFSIFKVKDLNSSNWASETLKNAVLVVRSSYLRYGDVQLIDDYDEKSQIYLCRVKFILTGSENQPDSFAEEWFSVRFVSGNGVPDSFEDFNHYLHGEEKISSHIQNILFSGEKDYLRKVVAISRFCGASARAINDGSVQMPGKLRHTALVFALFNLEFFSECQEFEYLVGVFRKELLTKMLDLRLVGINFNLSLPSAHVLLNCRPDEIRQNRNILAYKYPGYFLNILQLARIIDSLIADSRLSLDSIKKYVSRYELNMSAALLGMESLQILKRMEGIGDFLTVSGAIGGSLMTGEELRMIVDNEVDDGPELKMVATDKWRGQFEAIRPYLASRLAKNKRLVLKPVVLEAEQAHKDGMIAYDADGNVALKLSSGKIIAIPPQKQFDLTQATIFGLNERLTMSATSPVVDKTGKTLRDEFNLEWEKYSQKLLEMKDGYLDYGYYAYYPERNELARYCPPYWHHVVSVASSSKLLADPKNSLTWAQIRNLFENTTIAVAGCSVGSSIIHLAIMDLRPKNIKIADKSMYKMENINRVRLAYSEMVKSQAERTSPMDLSLKNKARVIAQQLYAIDPFLNVYIYDEGINHDNIDSFLSQNEGEPKTDIVAEEVDDPRIKILIRQEARKRGLPVIMVTDIGSAVQLDVLRYDQNKNLPLSYGISDEELLAKMEKVYDQAGNRKAFFEFVDALIGVDYRQEELEKIIEEKVEIPTSTIIPQLGSTVAMAGAIAAECVARVRLGFDVPSRAIINKHTFTVKVYP